MSSTAYPPLSPAQRQVAGVLAEVEDATILEITTAAAVSKSTVAKTLAILEEAGAAARTVHTDGDIRLADTWSPTVLTGPLLMGSDPGAHDGTSGNATSSTAHVPTAIDDEHGNESQDERSSVGDGTDHEPSADALADELTPNGPADDASVAGSGDGRVRLASGGLAQLVAERLTMNPLIEYTPTMLSHLLGGRSAGAISNALERMVANGTAMRTCEAPKRYRYVRAATASGS